MRLVTDPTGIPGREEMTSVHLTALALVEARLHEDAEQLYLVGKPADENDAFWLYIGTAELLVALLRMIDNQDPDQVLNWLRQRVIDQAVEDESS